MTRLLLIHSLVLICLSPLSSSGQQVKLHEDCVIEFATKKQAAEALTKQDVFVNALSRFDRQSRMQVEGNPTTEEYLDFVKENVSDWNDEFVEKATVALNTLSEKMVDYKIPFPKKILLVLTTGKEEGGAAYCRGATIVLPQTMVSKMSPRSLERLINHELFHVLSNQNSELRKKMYAIIGFKPCGEIKLPESLVDRKMTNPDGPTIDYYVEIKDEEMKSRPVVPVLFAKSKYDAKKGGSFFQYLNFQLMAIEKKGESWQPQIKDGRPEFFPPNGTPSYFDKIGMNTTYIIHPDEVLADNFVYMVQKKKKLKTPRIVEQLKELLAK